MGAYDVKQSRLIIRAKPLVELAHEGRLVDKGEAAERMDVGKVLLDDAAEVASRRKLGGQQPRDEDET